MRSYITWLGDHKNWPLRVFNMQLCFTRSLSPSQAILRGRGTRLPHFHMEMARTTPSQPPLSSITINHTQRFVSAGNRAEPAVVKSAYIEYSMRAPQLNCAHHKHSMKSDLHFSSTRPSSFFLFRSLFHSLPILGGVCFVGISSAFAWVLGVQFF